MRDLPKSFRRVWAGESVSMFGDYSYDVVFAWLVLSTTGSTTTTLAAVMISIAVPRGALLLVGGAVTDRFSPRTVMLISHLVRGGCVLALAVLNATGALSVWHFFVFGVISGVAEAFFWPASTSILPSLVPDEQLPKANALLGMSEQFGRLVGPIAGGVLVALGSTTIAMIVNAATFLFAALTLRGAPAGAPAERPETPLWREIGAGLRYARDNVEIRIVLLLVTAATLAYAGLFAVGLPALAKELSGDPIALGVLVASWGLGQLIGAYSASVTGLPRRWGLLIIGMTLCEGTAFAVIGFLPSVWVAAAVLAVIGVGVAYSSDVALPAFIQTTAPRELLGRVNSIIDLPRMTLDSVSIALMGVLIAVDVQWAFVGAALPMLLVGVGLAFSKTARGMKAAR
ncbi:MFS transporter [Allokutzneria sp. NRRL B-24872]|uniref:MFS transporter n=1 Tax=Allokutzneria sp. NRRL B-24872 TaxID=1137961 RepID=UPI000A37EA2E|nr:MFS transporter [Allokutzneria sp. NRRL B-24872]